MQLAPCSCCWRLAPRSLAAAAGAQPAGLGSLLAAPGTPPSRRPPPPPAGEEVGETTSGAAAAGLPPPASRAMAAPARPAKGRLRRTSDVATASAGGGPARGASSELEDPQTDTSCDEGTPRLGRLLPPPAARPAPAAGAPQQPPQQPRQQPPPPQQQQQQQGSEEEEELPPHRRRLRRPGAGAAGGGFRSLGPELEGSSDSGGRPGASIESSPVQRSGSPRGGPARRHVARVPLGELPARLPARMLRCCAAGQACGPCASALAHAPAEGSWPRAACRRRGHLV
jgi:hypothetical protein